MLSDSRELGVQLTGSQKKIESPEVKLEKKPEQIEEKFEEEEGET